MTDSRIQNLAKILVQTSTRLHPEYRVMIRGFLLEPVAEPLVKEVIREIRWAGGYLLFRLRSWIPMDWIIEQERHSLGHTCGFVSRYQNHA